MVHKLDNLHFNCSSIDGFQKPINIVVSPREDGKTTSAILKAWDAFEKRHATCILFKRLKVDVTDFYIKSNFDIVQKFKGKAPAFRYRQKDLDSGVIPVFVGDYMAFLVVALAVPKARYKSLFVPNPSMFISDEMIIDKRRGERYLSDEAFRAKEAYTTFYREGSRVPWYLFGNPYSLYNPYFQMLGVDGRELARKGTIAGSNFVARYHKLNPLLVEQILAKNPLYEFDDDYFDYAVKGVAVNDVNIRIREAMPQNYSLAFCIYQDGIMYGVYRNNEFDKNNRFWVGVVKNPNNKKVIAFDFGDLAQGVTLFTRVERERFVGFANAMRNRRVEFQSILCNNVMEEVYGLL